VNSLPNDYLLRCSSIDEILSNNFESIRSGKFSAGTAASKLAQWCEVSASGDWEIFEKRLKRDGFTLSEVLKKFAGIKKSTNRVSPQWLVDSQWVYAELTKKQTNKTAPTSRTTFPFDDSYENLIVRAISEVENITGPNWRRFWTTKAEADLFDALSQRISDLLSPVLYIQFRIRTKEQSEESQPGDDQSSDIYKSYVDDLNSSLYQDLFIQKPVLLRLIATVVRQWINVTSDLIIRLNSDFKNELYKLLAVDESVKVDSISNDIADPHNFGNAVRVITFSNNQRVVYKPKSMDIDIAWANLINYLNTLNPPTKLKTANVIAKDGYGWAEFINHSACEKPDDFDLFYYRSGSWLLMFYLLSGSDMHYGNIIANGSHPVPIDLEMTSQPSNPEQNSPIEANKATNAITNELSNSISAIGLLPFYTKSANGDVFDASGLSPFSGHDLDQKWININSDRMKLIQQKTKKNSFPNVPFIKSSYAQFHNHKVEFAKGFETYAEFIQASRNTPEFEALISGFSNLEVRKVIRPTRFYYMLLTRLKDHRKMSDGISWSAQADFISRFTEWDEKDPLWPLQQSERTALLNLNIPFFVTNTDKKHISDNAGPITKTESIPGYARIKKRVSDFNDEHIIHQKEILKASMMFYGEKERRDSTQNYTKEKDAVSGVDLPKGIKERSIFLVKEIFKIISSNAYSGGSSINWRSLGWLDDSTASLEPLRPDLFSGTVGISLFLANYAKTIGDEKAHNLSVRSLASIRHQIKGANSARWARSLGVGGTKGLGSITYSLGKIGIALDDREIINDAVASVDLYDNDLIKSCSNWDTTNGLSGGILSLLSLYTHTTDESVIEKAIECGDQLIFSDAFQTYLQDVDSNQANLPIIDLNLSNGISGILLALHRLSRMTLLPRFVDAKTKVEDILAKKLKGIASHTEELSINQAYKTPYSPTNATHLSEIGLVSLSLSSHTEFSTEQESFIRKLHSLIRTCSANTYQRNQWESIAHSEFTNSYVGLKMNDTISDVNTLAFLELIKCWVQNVNENSDAYMSRFNLGFYRGIAGLGYSLLRSINPKLANILLFD
jgi:type 2 lantibiotic biosynthesis protein LanM